jgi:ribose 5-phosphate isomerase B
MIGGSGQGETIALNKIRGVRAGLCNSLFDAEISSGNNNANILVLAGKVLSSDFAEEILTLWLSTPFRGGVHQKRLDLISMLEAGKELN